MEASFTSHHQAKARCFFKIILCEISPKSKLMIPEKFVRKYGEELQGGVLLKAPGAPPWSVDVLTEKGKVWLQNGWPEFAKFYSVCFGHFIYFEYQGNCKFKVVIFDTSTTEIDYPVPFKERSESDRLQVFKKKQVHSGCNAGCYLGHSVKGKLPKEKIAEALSETSNRLKLGCGWQQFAEDNALAVGDVCVFKLVSPSKKLIDVLIYRAAVVEEEDDDVN